MSFEACGPKLACLLEDLLWGPFLNNPPLLQAIDPVTVLDRGQPVSNDEHGFLAFEAFDLCNDHSLGPLSRALVASSITKTLRPW